MSKRSEDEIVDFMQHMLSISITKQHLAKPTKELVINIYSRFLQIFSFENLNQPDIIAFSGISNIEYYDQIIVQINIFKAIEKYVSLLGINDFCLDDIISPKRTRTIRIINVLSSILVKNINVKNDWAEIQEQFVDNPKKINLIEQKNLEFKHCVEEKSMLISSLKSKSIGLDKELNSLEDVLAKNKRIADECSIESKDIKSRIIPKKENLCEIDIKTSELRENNLKLSETIVKSPMKVINSINDMENELKMSKEECLMSKTQYSNCLITKDFYDKKFKSLKQSIEEFNDLMVLFCETNGECDDLEKNKQKAIDIKEKTLELQMQIKEAKLTKQTLHSQISKDAKLYAREFQTLTDLLAGIRKVLCDKDESKRSCISEQTEMRNKLECLEQEIEQLQTTFRPLMDRYETVYHLALDKLLHS